MFIISLVGFITVVLFGYLLVNIFLTKESFLEKTFLGFIIGYGFFSYSLFLVSLCGIKFELFTSSLVLGFLIGLLLTINKILALTIFPDFDLKHLFNKWRRKFDNLSLLGKISFIWVVILVFSVVLYDLFWPLRGFDAFVMYDFRAKSFVATGSMDDAIKRGYFIAHPLMTSLSHTWLYLIGFTSPMFFYSLFYIAFVVLIYIAFRKLLDRNLSIILTAATFSLPDIYSQAQVAYTNLPYTTYLVLGSIYLYLGIKFKKNSLIIMSMLLTALSGWTRSVDPFWLVNVIVVLIYGVYKLKNLFIALIYAIAVYLFRLPWNRFYEANTKTVLNIQNQIQGATKTLIVGVSRQSNFDKIFSYFYLNVIEPYLVLYFLSFILIFFKIIQKSRDWWYFLIFFGNLSLLFLGAYVFSLSYSEWANIPSSFKRLALFLVPMIIFFTATFLGEFQSWLNTSIKKLKTRK